MAESRRTERKAGLGRGLEALLPMETPERGFATIPVDRIFPSPAQLRVTIDEMGLESLAASIREVGVLQPVLVRPADDDGQYVLIAGERRWRAARLAGLTDIPALVRQAEDAQALSEALVENLQREDLTPLEEAAAFRQLLEDFGLTHQEVGERVGKSRTAVSNALRLLQLPAAIQGLVERGELSAGHARALLGLDDEAYARHVARRAAQEGWSVRQVEDSVRARRRVGEGQARTPRASRVKAAALLELEERLGDRLGAPVTIDYAGRSGKLVVRFRSLDELERIYRRLFVE